MEISSQQGHFSFKEFNRMDIVDFLTSHGIHPQKVVRNNYWYLSPLRDEKIPSFKVNRKQNCWHDFGTGEGTTLTDFCIRYFHCTISELVQKYAGLSPFILRKRTVPVEQAAEETLTIDRIHPLESPLLIHYFRERRIPLHLAQRYCRQALYRMYGKSYYAICFRNRSGGCELRNRFFKGSSSPKDLSVIQANDSDEIVVFEGFFDFLSYLALGLHGDGTLPHFLVLNSLSLIERAFPVFHRYKKIQLFFDNDSAGIKYKDLVKMRFGNSTDQSGLYAGYKDLNDWLCRIRAKNLPD